MTDQAKRPVAEAGSYHGRNFHFGIREHAMCAMANGMSLVKVRPFASTFLIFTDYARGAIRLSALMEIPVIYIWTHDSISVGEDGPTHQPIEQLASLRAMPGILVIRPADANEVTEAWRVIMPLRHEPAVLVLSRQLCPRWTAPVTPRPRAWPAAATCTAPIQQIQAKFGFEPGHVIEAAKDQLAVWRRE